MKLVVDRGYNLETMEEALEIFKDLRKKLSEREHLVVDCTPEKWSNIGDFLYKTAINANNMKGDLLLSLNLNNGKDKRCIVYTKEKCKIDIEKIRDLEKYGFEIVLIQSVENLYLFKNVKYPTVIMVFTITSKEDIKAICKNVLTIID